MEQFTLADYLAIAAEVIGAGSDQIVNIANIPLADSAVNAPYAGFGDTEFYPDPVEKAAILCSRLIRNHPLPDGNKRSAYLSMLIFIETNGLTWNPPSEDERVATIEDLAARTLAEPEFTEWVRQHVDKRPSSRRGIATGPSAAGVFGHDPYPSRPRRAGHH